MVSHIIHRDIKQFLLGLSLTKAQILERFSSQIVYTHLGGDYACCRLNVYPPNPYSDAPNPNKILLEDGPLGDD